ncbi:hydroxyethylthiazole kinase [Fructilactobacillus carniphilus]|uniref:Hydroxyethylthiazole kinase n=1 Tax=Fructilactobacillus carniphilus TaxID=2940297 RepID=A0ABY5BW81_9LACO|nr:hydroxyethylthiazole kinase [Fructilactobacillus carniphilus]USS90317.1 hydroxyethylthiazole kinase [Fructilactobacillus carniphilus]
MKTNLLAQIHSQTPIVLNVANHVTPQRVADGINYIGGSPMMVADPLEAADLAHIANTVVLNLGSTNPVAQELMLTAGQAANQVQHPVIFDPVAVGATPLRRQRTQQLLEHVQVMVIRGNAGEVAALAGIKWEQHGIDAGQGTADPVEVAQTAAQQLNCVVVISGPTDIVTDGTTVYRIANNAPLLTTNVGMGDVLDGLLGVATGVSADLETIATATGILPVAAELAAERYPDAPFSFIAETYNQLARLDDQTLQQRLQLQKN